MLLPLLLILLLLFSCCDTIVVVGAAVEVAVGVVGVAEPLSSIGGAIALLIDSFFVDTTSNY